MKIQSLSTLPMGSQETFLTFLELRSKIVLQYSPKHVKSMGTCLKTQKKLRIKRIIINEMAPYSSSRSKIDLKRLGSRPFRETWNTPDKLQGAILCVFGCLCVSVFFFLHFKTCPHILEKKFNFSNRCSLFHIYLVADCSSTNYLLIVLERKKK